MTNEEIKQKSSELCWAIEELPASEQQTKVSLMASELSRLVEGLVMQAAPPGDENSGKKADKPIFVIKPIDDENFDSFIQLFCGDNGSLAIIKNKGFEIYETKKLL